MKTLGIYLAAFGVLLLVMMPFMIGRVISQRRKAPVHIDRVLHNSLLESTGEIDIIRVIIEQDAEEPTEFERDPLGSWYCPPDLGDEPLFEATWEDLVTSGRLTGVGADIDWDKELASV